MPPPISTQPPMHLLPHSSGLHRLPITPRKCTANGRATAMEHHKSPVPVGLLSAGKSQGAPSCWLGPLGPSPILCHAPHLQLLPARRVPRAERVCTRKVNIIVHTSNDDRHSL